MTMELKYYLKRFLSTEQIRSVAKSISEVLDLPIDHPTDVDSTFLALGKVTYKLDQLQAINKRIEFYAGRTLYIIPIELKELRNNFVAMQVTLTKMVTAYRQKKEVPVES
jgi:hypothetical protein